MAATLLRTLYGFEAKDNDDRMLALIWDCVEGTRELLISGGFLMDFFPILRFAPWFVPFHRKLARWRAGNVRFKDEPFAWYKAQLVSATLAERSMRPTNKLRYRGIRTGRRTCAWLAKSLQV